MKTSPKRAYDLISAALADEPDVRLVHSDYFPDHFGNFHLAYWRNERAVSIVLDRGQLFVCDDLKAEKGRMVGDLFESDEAEIMETLRPEW
jgi:hypothetical protein